MVGINNELAYALFRPAFVHSVPLFQSSIDVSSQGSLARFTVCVVKHDVNGREAACCLLTAEMAHLHLQSFLVYRTQRVTRCWHTVMRAKVADTQLRLCSGRQ